MYRSCWSAIIKLSNSVWCNATRRHLYPPSVVVDGRVVTPSACRFADPGLVGIGSSGCRSEPYSTVPQNSGVRGQHTDHQQSRGRTEGTRDVSGLRGCGPLTRRTEKSGKEFGRRSHTCLNRSRLLEPKSIALLLACLLAWGLNPRRGSGPEANP